MRLALGVALKFYINVAKWLEIKTFWGPILTFAEVTGEKLVGWSGIFAPSILHNVK